MIDLSDSEKLAKYFIDQLTYADVEEFWIFALNPQCKLIQARMLFRGTVDQCFFHPRDVFRFALIQNASYLIVAHNHPSGNVEPSNDDLKITKQLFKLSKLMQIPILDHVIVDKKSQAYFSFKKTKSFTEQPR